MTEQRQQHFEALAAERVSCNHSDCRRRRSFRVHFGSWNEIPFAWLPVGPRRAKRFSRWLGGNGTLPRPGREIVLPMPVKEGRRVSLTNRAGLLELTGSSEDLSYLHRVMLGQEAAERAGRRA